MKVADREKLDFLRTAFMTGDVFLLAGEIIRRRVPTISRELKEIAINYVCNDVSNQNTSYWRSVADKATDRLGVPISVRTAKYYAQDKYRK